jgi:DNA-binding NarL/FixJ family response regulator
MMNTDDIIRVLVVDGGGNEATTARLRQTLSAGTGIIVAGEVGSGEEALAAARRLCPDVIVMLADSEMPGMDSIQTTRVITREGLSTRVVIITENMAENLTPAIKAGAAALFSPGAGSEELLSILYRIRQWSPYSLSLQG